jgi:hypothetical protein
MNLRVGGAAGGQRTLQAPHTMQWAVRQRETAGPTSTVNAPGSRPPTTAVAATTTGTSIVFYS